MLANQYNVHILLMVIKPGSGERKGGRMEGRGGGRERGMSVKRCVEGHILDNYISVACSDLKSSVLFHTCVVQINNY